MKSTYFKLLCLFVLLFVVCYSAEIFVNKYSYEKGKPINKVKIPDIIQESIPIIRNLDVVSDLFISLISFVFIIIFVINGKYQYIILYLQRYLIVVRHVIIRLTFLKQHLIWVHVIILELADIL
jgi:hypothetical protein